MADATLPVDGSCNCGAVRFRVSGPFVTAGYCHCTHCQKRTGTGASFTGLVAREHFEFLSGKDRLRNWKPSTTGRPKWFCVDCGSHLFAGPLDQDTVGIRIGAFDGPVDVEPRWRIFVRSAPDWAPVPDDGVTRYETTRPA